MRRPVFHNHNRFSAVNGSSEGKNARKTEPVAGSEKLGTTYQLVDETEKTMLCSILRMNTLVSRKKTPRRFFFLSTNLIRACSKDVTRKASVRRLLDDDGYDTSHSTRVSTQPSN